MERVKMEQSGSARQEYASFLIRMWRELDPAPPAEEAEWHGEIEHIQSGQQSTFASVTELYELLRQPLATDKGLREATQ
jgi:hypothetical protein